MFCYEWDFFGETAAAWVQAIGTLAALWLAIRAPIWHAKKAEQDATIEQVQLFLALATEITSRCDLILEKLARNPEASRYDIPSLHPLQMIEFAKKCKGVDFTMLRDYRMLHFINRFPDQVETFANDLWAVHRTSADDIEDVLLSKVGVAKSNYEHVTATVNELKTLLAEYQRPWWRRPKSRGVCSSHIRMS